MTNIHTLNECYFRNYCRKLRAALKYTFTKFSPLLSTLRMTMGNEYLINKVLEEAIARFQETKLKKNDLTETLKDRDQHQADFDEVQGELANLFYLLAENIIRAFGFKLIDRDDALQEGVMICLQKLDQFKP